MKSDAPAAPSRTTVRTFHGEEVDDPFEWLRDKDQPEVIDLLEAENRYTAKMTSHLRPLESTIFTEIKARTKETDLAVPSLMDGWWYYSRTTAGEQYPVFARVRDRGARPALSADAQVAGEQIIIDAERGTYRYRLADDSEPWNLRLRFLQAAEKQGGLANHHAHFDKAYLITNENLRLSQVDMQKKWDEAHEKYMPFGGEGSFFLSQN